VPQSNSISKFKTASLLMNNNKIFAYNIQ